MLILSNNFFKISNRILKPTFTHSLSKLRHGHSYDGDGKTTANILNKDFESGLLIDSYTNIGFQFNNGITALGPIIIFPKTILSWKINHAMDLTKDAFSLFEVLEPRVDILIVGVGNSSNVVPASKMILFGKEFKTNVEILNTQHAIAHFNFLNAENRNVAAALIPPETIILSEDDILRTKMNHGFYNQEFL